jgi:hypothetical protein
MGKIVQLINGALIALAITVQKSPILELGTNFTNWAKMAKTWGKAGHCLLPMSVAILSSDKVHMCKGQED